MRNISPADSIENILKAARFSKNLKKNLHTLYPHIILKPIGTPYPRVQTEKSV